MQERTDFNINLIGDETKVREWIDRRVENNDFKIPSNEHVWAVSGISVRVHIVFPKKMTVEEVKLFLLKRSDSIFRIDSVGFACIGCY